MRVTGAIAARSSLAVVDSGLAGLVSSSESLNHLCIIAGSLLVNPVHPKRFVVHVDAAGDMPACLLPLPPTPAEAVLSV
jgi:hypothetical protein